MFADNLLPTDYAINAKLGISINNDGFKIQLWQPLATKVHLVIYDQFDPNIITTKLIMEHYEQVWSVKVNAKYEKYYYQFEIFHPDGSVTLALDPYALSMAPFNWNGQLNHCGKACIVNLKKCLLKNKINLQTNIASFVDPFIYELHIRDFTSGLNQENFQAPLGTFNATIEHDIFAYLQKLNINYLQLLPLHETFTINATDQTILKKNEGKGWFTNYNWGYDPHNFFTINGWYSSQPQDPYNRILEFLNFVNQAHANNIGIIVDVVFNHVMDHFLFDAILPNYYFRKQSNINPVNQSAFATEKKMVAKLFIDCLVFWTTFYNVDGFRFDLSSFFTKDFLEELVTTLKSINPKIVLHGEAWRFSDLDYDNSWIINHNSNEYAFAYFNDTIRNTLRGSDEETIMDYGLIAQPNLFLMQSYVSSIYGNLENLKFTDEIQKFLENTLNSKKLFFLSNIEINLQYVACHDGYTLWDKVNFVNNCSFEEKINLYRQIFLASITIQGRQLMLAGTELCQTKPLDISGQDNHRFFCGVDHFALKPDKNGFHANSYKTTDYVNCIKWQNLSLPLVQDYVFTFVAELIKFRQESDYFRKVCLKDITNDIKIIKVLASGLIIYEVFSNNQSVLIIHNFAYEPMAIDLDVNLANYQLVFNSRIKSLLTNNIPGKTSWILERKY